MTNQFKRLLQTLIPAIMAALFLCSCGSEESLTDTMDNLIADQRNTDSRIEKELKNSDNTLDDPLILENPYKVAPLSALLVFRTPEPSGIKMTINDKTPVVFEKTKEHALPVYGLYDDFNNKVEIIDEKGNANTLTIKTKKYKGKVLDVEKNDLKPSEEFFLVSPDYENTSAYESNGKLLWYLDLPDIEGAVIFLGDGRFLISDPYQGAGGIRINYSGFMEADYLGKVRKLYLGEYGYHHEIVRIKNNTEYLLPGHDEDSPFMQGILYTTDAKTMQVKQKIDFYDVFRKHAPKWTKDLVKKEKFNFVINGIDYDEKTGDALASVRSLGMIIRINMDSEKIKWIFADPANLPKEMKKYLLKPTDNTRYPYGQHACTFLPGGRISYHNNDVDFLAGEMYLSSFKNNYSSNEILKVDEDDLKVSTDWTFDGNKDIISKMSGSLEFLKDGHKLISYGSAILKSEYDKPEKVEIMNEKKIKALMMELDKNDKVIWKATFPSIIHKVYRSTFYGNSSSDPSKQNGEDPSDPSKPTSGISNYDVHSFEPIDGQDTSKHLGKKVNIDKISSQLEDADELEGSFSLMINRAVLDTRYKKSDKIKILFVDESDKGTEYVYKKAGEELPIINSGRYGIRVAGLKGKQKVYVSIGDTWYNTLKVIDFE